MTLGTLLSGAEPPAGNSSAGGVGSNESSEVHGAKNRRDNRGRVLGETVNTRPVRVFFCYAYAN